MRAIAHDARRRKLLLAGSSLFLTVPIWRPSKADDEIIIDMAGTSAGTHVWFRPRGVLLRPGQSVRWVNSDVGNVHTVTAYHPDNGKPLRIPAQAAAWNSGYLMPEASFVMTFDVPGVYDYFCIPHEQAGMVGRLIVGADDVSTHPYSETGSQLFVKALAGFPPVEDILQNRSVD